MSVTEKSWEKTLNKIKEAKVVKRPRGNPGAAPHHLYYKDVICAFDIETTKLDDNNSIIYSWQFCCDNEDCVIIGRSWEEFIYFMQKVKIASKGAAVVVYVHNLPFEFQYLSGVIPFNSPDVLSGKKREVIKAYSEPFEFRCSYRLTGLSLEHLTNKFDVKHKKIEGFDYNKIRYPWSKLSEFEISYLKNDVIGLVEAIKEIFKNGGDSIYTVPITQTGYIRRVIKKAMRSYPWKKIEEQKISYKTYKMLSVAMRGGICHANRYRAGYVLENIDSWDGSSWYPAALMYGDFPIGGWCYEQDPDLDHFLRLIYLRKKAVLATITFKRLKVKNRQDPWPYISKSKSYIIGKSKVDNGRVLSADELSGIYTDIDFKIIMEQYDFEEITVEEYAHTKKGKLPKQIRDEVKKLYQKKTALKGVNPVEYELTKILINGCFGMMSEDPGKVYNYYDPDKGTFEKENITEEQALERKNKNAFLSYAWGVWTTAICRSWMQSILNKVGDKAIYVDTDGIKLYKGYDYIFEEFNAEIEKMALAEGGCQAVDEDGVIHTLGAFEKEAHFDKFITLGAKKYAFKQGKEITIATAGVNKKDGGKELKSLENYKEGFTFYKAGGRDAIYNDFVDEWREIEGHKVHVTKNLTLIPSTYTLGLTAEYKRLILYTDVVLAFMKQQEYNK